MTVRWSRYSILLVKDRQLFKYCPGQVVPGPEPVVPPQINGVELGVIADAPESAIGVSGNGWQVGALVEFVKIVERSITSTDVAKLPDDKIPLATRTLE